MEGGFSIREYASRMRSINVVNCWPFDDSLSDETVKSLLPPIVIKRFTWWLDELDLLTSQTAQKLNISQKTTDKVSDKGETSSRNVCRDFEEGGECVKAAELKSLKGKMRATKKRSIVDIFAVAPPVKWETEEDEEEDENCNVGMNRASKKYKKKVKNTDAILRKALRVVKNIKRNKENSLRTQKKAIGNSNDSISIPKGKPRLQDFGRFKKLMPCKSSKLIEENQDLELPVHGILKNHDKEISTTKSKKCMLKEAVQLNKHVTFSESTENLRASRKPSQSVERFELHCGFKKANADYAVAVGQDSTVSETSGSEDAYARTGKELGAINEPLTAFSIDSSTLGKQKYKSEHSTRFENSERNAMCSLNQNWSGTVDIPHDGYYNSPDFEVVMASSNATRSRLNKDIGAPCTKIPPPCFKDYLRTHNDASMANIRRPYELSPATALDCAHSFHKQEFSHLSPDEMLQTFCYVPNESSAEEFHERNVNEKFVGLPLNSQGELIALSSSVSSDQSIGLRLPSNNISMEQLNLFPVESYMQENASMVALPSRLDIIESQGEKENLDFDFLEINYHPFLNPEKNIRSRGNDHAQKNCENEKLQSTMRLMGKEFEVGGRVVEGYEDGRVWKDQQVIDELLFQNPRNEPCFRQLGETRFHPSETSVNHTSESNYRSVFLTRPVDCTQNMYPSLSPGTFSDVYKSKSLFSEPYTAGHDRELRLDMIPGAMKSKQNLHYPPISSIKFPFMHPDLDANSSWPQRTLSNHPYLNPSTSCGINASVPFQSNDFCRFNYFPSLAPPTVPHAPYYSGVLPVSAMQRLQRKQNKIKARIKSRIGIQGIDFGKKTKAPLSPHSNAPFKPFLRPTIHEGAAAFESCSTTKNPRYGPTISPWPDSYIEDARTGPVKLAVGAKHVLMPRHLKDAEISLSTINIGSRFSESENAAKVYQF